MMTDADAAQGAPAGTGDPVSETTDARFLEDVIEASSVTPVIVDFWAPWCGPCKQLAPVLEKEVRAARGRVRLVKVNIDENPEVAAQLRVQSIPAVFAFVDGRPVDGFMGAQSPRQIESFVRSLTSKSSQGDPVEEALEQAEEALESGGAAEAAQVFSLVLEQEPENARAMAGLARCYIAGGDLERAERILDSAAEKLKDDDVILAARTALGLAKQAGDLAPEADLRRRLEQDPADHQARFDLALLLASNNRRVDAVDELLELFRRDRNWNDGAAKARLLEMFETFGEKDEATQEGRRKLSSLLFA